MSKLRNIVDNEVVKKTVYGKLVAKVNTTNTGGYVLKTQYSTEKSSLAKKMTLTRKNLLLVEFKKKADYNAKIIE